MKSSELTATASFSPILNEVLKEYQTAAMSSLSGPNNVLKSWKAIHGKDEVMPLKKRLSPISPSSPYPSSSVSPQFPILLPPDQSPGERGETVLEGQCIACFLVGGERRLCLPQILNSVLSEFQLPQINHVCDALQIFCSRCTPEQLDDLKRSGILPPSAYCCGLITKTNAERLCMELLHSSAPQLPLELSVRERPNGFHVYHKCFGKGRGIFISDWYTAADTRCIECTVCKGMFSPEVFVGHSHGPSEHRTCHWGFDRANWRSYLLLTSGQADNETLQKTFSDLKSRFDGPKYKRKSEAPYKETKKKPKVDDFAAGIPYSFDPLLYWPWFNVLFGRNVIPSAWSQLEKDEKNFPCGLFKESPLPLPGYIGPSASSLLLNPNGLLPFHEGLDCKNISPNAPSLFVPPKELKNHARLKSNDSGGGCEGTVKKEANESTSLALKSKAHAKDVADAKMQEYHVAASDPEESCSEETKLLDEPFVYDRDILQRYLDGVEAESRKNIISFMDHCQVLMSEKLKQYVRSKRRSLKKISLLINQIGNIKLQHKQEVELLMSENDRLLTMNCKLRKELESLRHLQHLAEFPKPPLEGSKSEILHQKKEHVCLKNGM